MKPQDVVAIILAVSILFMLVAISLPIDEWMLGATEMQYMPEYAAEAIVTIITTIVGGLLVYISRDKDK